MADPISHDPFYDVTLLRHGGPLAVMLADRRPFGDRIFHTDDVDASALLRNGRLHDVSTPSAPVDNVTGSDVIIDGGQSEPLNWGVMALSLVIVATAIGNILVCLAVCWDRRLQNMTNYFLMSLAIADLLVAILVMPLGLVVELYGLFPLKPSLCVMWATTDVLMCTASIWHMCTMSMDRYFTLKYPMKYGRNKTKMMVALKITFVWIISIAICSPLCIMGFLNYDNVFDPKLLLCAPNIPSFVIYGSVFAFYVPLFIMVVTYLLTTRILRTNQKLMCNMIQEQHAYKTSADMNGAVPNSVSGVPSADPASLTVSSLPIRKSAVRSREASLSERASLQESDDFLERKSASRSGSCGSTSVRIATVAQPIQPTTQHIRIAGHSVRVGIHPARPAPADYDPLSPPISENNFTFGDGQDKHQGALANKVSLSVSQPHLPSIDDRNKPGRHRLLAPSKSHNSLNTPQHHHRSQLSVSNLESVKNFDSLISLNSVLSNNWGSQAWSDFDDPAMFEKLSQIEAEMDECLFGDLEPEPADETQTGRGTTSSGNNDSCRDLSINLDSSPVDSTRGAVFVYPDSNPASPDVNTDTDKVKVKDSEGCPDSCTSASSRPAPETNSRQGSTRTTPLSPNPDNLSSPAIMVEDMSCNNPTTYDRDRTRANSCKEKTKPRTMTPSRSSLSDNSFRIEQSSGSTMTRQRLQLDLDTLVLTAIPDPEPCSPVTRSTYVAPIITTSPASSRSQTSPQTGSGSPTSSRPSFSTCPLNTPSSGGSPWEPRSNAAVAGMNKIDVTLNQDGTSTQNFRLTPPVGDLHKLQTPDATSLSPCGSFCKQSYCQSPSLVETELISQEVERSTDDTLSDQQSFSTSSASRYHIPSLSVHWSAKEHGIHLRTFLRQVSFRRSGSSTASHFGKKRVMSKRRASNEKKASKVLGIIFAVFVVLWSPFFVVNIMTALCIQCRYAITPPVISSLVWLGYLSSLANPIIYTMFNTSFRRAFVNILTCRLGRRYGRASGGQRNRKRIKQPTGTSTFYSTYASDRKPNQ